MKKNRYPDNISKLEHIKQAIELIESYISNQTESSFCTNNLVHDAVLFQFTVIGEAIRYVDKAILDKYNYSWFKVRAFRNFITHEYFNIKLEAVWYIIEKDLPELKAIINDMIKSNDNIKSI
jgi:uncharacterized protein with HEPN domain